MDEADRILNMDFGVEVDKIVKAIPRERQTFLFSATMTKKVPCPSAGGGAAVQADCGSGWRAGLTDAGDAVAWPNSFSVTGLDAGKKSYITIGAQSAKRSSFLNNGQISV